MNENAAYFYGLIKSWPVGLKLYYKYSIFKLSKTSLKNSKYQIFFENQNDVQVCPLFLGRFGRR